MFCRGVERKRGANRGEFVVVLWWVGGGMHGKTASISGDEKHANFLGFIFRTVALVTKTGIEREVI